MATGESREESKICFVVAPIGEPDSETRKRSDQVLKHVIQPAVKSLGYEAVRADQISEPGIITTQIIQHIIDDPLVVADLSGRNPNVFYELAIRHALRKPYLQLIQSGERIPFDVAAIRTIEVDHKDLDSVEAAKGEIVRQVQSMQSKSGAVDSPISVAVDLEALRQSGNPEERQLADVLAAVGELRSGLSAIEKRLSDPTGLLPPAYLRDTMLQELRPVLSEVADTGRRSRSHPGMLLEEVFVLFDRLSTILEPGEGKEPSRTKIEEARELLRRSDRFLHMLLMESGMPRGMIDEFMERRLRRKKAE